MRFLYPADPLRPRQPDPCYAAEAEAARAAGHDVSVFSFENLLDGRFQATPAIRAATVVYRGWMLSSSQYQTLIDGIADHGSSPLTDLAAYLGAHHLPNWYPTLAEFTPETVMFPLDCDLAAELNALHWPAYFVKDYVKSLKTSVGSLITSPGQASAVVAEMRRLRGTIEGGFCIRRVENFVEGSERRYFVVDSTPHAPCGGAVPAIVRECAKRIRSRFFSVDVVRRTDGLMRVVEIGDGQVSGLVGWKPGCFVALWKAPN